MTGIQRHAVLTAEDAKAQTLSDSGLKQLLMAYRGKNANAIVAPGFKFRKGMVYTCVRAISNRINQNFDAWPSEELKKSYKTFIGKPVFVNHANEDPELARGRVAAARYVEAGDDKYIETIMEIDAERFSKLAKELIDGGLDSVSMGVEAGITICSYCGNKAVNEPDFCDHVLHHKGEYLPRKTASGEIEDVLVYEKCGNLHFFELSYVFDPADETAVVSKVLVANKKRAFGETEAPAEVDTLRREEVGDEEDLHRYVEPPVEFEDPDLDEAGRLDRIEDELGEDVVIEPSTLDDSELIETLNALEDEATNRGYDTYGLQNDEPEGVREDTFDEFSEFEDEDPQAHLFDDLDEPESNFEEPSIKALSRNIGTKSRHNTIVEGTTGRRLMSVGMDDFSQEEFAPVPPSGDGIDSFLDEVGGGDEGFGGDEFLAEDDSVVDTSVLSDEEILDTLDDLQDEAEVRGLVDSDSEGESSEESTDDYFGDETGDTGADDFVPTEDEDTPPEEKVSRKRKRSRDMGKSSLAGRGRVAARGQLRHQLRGKTAGGPLVDTGDQSRNDQGEQEEAFITQTPSGEAVETADDGDITNTEQNLVARISQSKQQLMRDIKAHQQHQRKRLTQIARSHPNPAVRQKAARLLQAAPNTVDQATMDANWGGQGAELMQGLQQAGPYTPTAKKLTTIARSHPDPAIRQRAAQLLGDKTAGVSDRQKLTVIARSHPNPKIRRQAMGYLAAENTDDAHTVDPALSGTDEQSLKGDSFDNLELDYVETQPKDASKQAFSAFDKWLQSTTGKTASKVENIGALRRAAKKWSAQSGIPVSALFPTLGNVLREARKNVKKKSNESLEVAAPGGRVDVEAPVEGDTDAEAQASQYDLHDFGDNAGDNIADPDLSTGDQIWAPGEKSSARAPIEKANIAQAMRCAKAYVKVGLNEETDEYNLTARFAQMSRPIVAMQTRLLEQVAQIMSDREVQIRRASSGTTRGAQTLPRGVTRAAATQAVASTERVAENDPQNDCLIFLK